jgi:uncharacterized protein involved in exopolysaccharide biosynthesis
VAIRIGMTISADSDGTGPATATTGPAPQGPWLHDMLAAIGRRWWLVPAVALLAIIVALVYLSRAEYVYSAELKIYAAPSASGSRAPSALGGLAALAGVAAGSGTEQVSPFRYYLDGIYSPEVAARMARDRTLMHRIFANEWDARNQRWRQPSSLLGSIRRGVTGAMDLPEFGWTPPDATRLQAYIAEAIKIRQSVKTPVVTVSYDYPDPEFAKQFLATLHNTVDSYLREAQNKRTRGNIDYLAGQLRQVTLAEQRSSLVTALSEQERQAMLAYGNAPYAADAFDVVTASQGPTRPSPGRLLIGAAIAGLLLGLVLAAVVGRRDRRQTDG